MHGANNGNIAEFRVPSFKGVLRYFWRTLQEETNPEKLLEKEEGLFGGTMTNEKRKSPLSIYLPELIQAKQHTDILPHKNSKSKVPAVPVNQDLTVKVRVQKKNEDLMNKYELYMNYLFHIAGFGQRSRRGFGSIQWMEHKWQSVTDYANSLKQVLQDLEMEELYFVYNESPHLLQRRGDVRTPHPILNSIWIGEGRPSYQEVLKAIGYASHFGNRNGTLGSMKPRKASPLLVTVRKIGDLYYPIISEVKTKEKYNQPYEMNRRRFLQELGVMI